MSEVRLRDLGRWLSGGTPDTRNPAYWNGDIPWITSSSLNTRYVKTSKRKLTSQGVDAGSRLVPPDTLLFVVRGMSLKNEFRVGLTRCSVAFGQDCKAIVPAGGVDPRFLLFALEAAEDKVLRMVDEASHGTGRLQTSLVGSLLVWLPPLEEQGRITAILDAIDDTIHATERVIAKTTQTKRGLVEEVLAREEGDPVRLDTVAGVGGGKRLPGGHDYSSTPTRMRYLRVVDFYGRQVDYGSLESLSTATFDSLRRYEIREGDCFISIAGSIGFVGACNPPTSLRVILTENAARLVCDNSILPKYLAMQMNAEAVQSQIAREVGTGGGVPKLALHRIASLRVRRPSLESQMRAVNAADALEAKILSAQRTVDKLRQIRARLASDLLSGRVRG